MFLEILVKTIGNKKRILTRPLYPALLPPSTRENLFHSQKRAPSLYKIRGSLRRRTCLRGGFPLELPSNDAVFVFSENSIHPTELRCELHRKPVKLLYI